MLKQCLSHSKTFRSFKIPAISLIWPKSLYKHRVTQLYRSGKATGCWSESPLWCHHWCSFLFISHADDVKYEKHAGVHFMVVNQSEARISNEHGIKLDVACITVWQNLILHITWQHTIKVYYHPSRNSVLIYMYIYVCTFLIRVLL